MPNPTQRNILMLHSSSDMYGASKILLITASFLQKANFKVCVVLSEDGPLVQALQRNNIDVEICRLGILRRKYFNPLGMLNRVGVLHRARKQLTALARERNIDTVYSNTTGVLVGALVARACKAKHVWHVHEIIESPAVFVKFIAFMLRKYSDQIIVVSNEVRKHWAQWLPAHKIKTVYNGLDYSEYLGDHPGLREELKLEAHHTIIGMIGRVNLWKGQPYFLEMASLIAAQYPNARFAMAGDAYPGYEYLYDELEAFIQKSGLSGKVFTLGFRTDVPYLLQGFDLFVLPSIQPDPLPTVVLEAMGSGTPVIATAHGGALEMVLHGHTGFHIPWNNAPEAVAICTPLLDDPHTRTAMGSRARERALEHFSHEKFEKNLIETLRNV